MIYYCLFHVPSNKFLEHPVTPRTPFLCTYELGSSIINTLFSNTNTEDTLVATLLSALRLQNKILTTLLDRSDLILVETPQHFLKRRP